jgi:Ser/Thr protein kinase RdoA (MazF antagonist)
MEPMPNRVLDPVDVVLDVVAQAMKTSVVVHGNHSWAHGESTVVEVRAGDGEPWIVKQVRDPDAFQQEVRALRRWAPKLGDGMAPRLLAAVADRSVMVMNRLPGEAGAASTAAHFRQAGRLVRRLHEAEQATADSDYPGRASYNVDRWVSQVPGVVNAMDLDFVRGEIKQMESMPAVHNGPIHNDNQPRNWLIDSVGTVRIIDFGKAKRDVQLRDFERMQHEEWQGRPDLREAFFDGYGRALSDSEQRMLSCIGAVAAVTTILWARAHGDESFEQHGWNTLRFLQNATPER